MLLVSAKLIDYRTHGISNTVTNIMSEIFTGVSNRAVLQIGWCFKYKSCRGELEEAGAVPVTVCSSSSSHCSSSGR